jgi:hypothetical protein
MASTAARLLWGRVNFKTLRSAAAASGNQPAWA